MGSYRRSSYIIAKRIAAVIAITVTAIIAQCSRVTSMITPANSNAAVIIVNRRRDHEFVIIAPVLIYCCTYLSANVALLQSVYALLVWSMNGIAAKHLAVHPIGVGPVRGVWFLLQTDIPFSYKLGKTLEEDLPSTGSVDDVMKHSTVRTGAKYWTWVLVKCVWCSAYYWFRLRKGTRYGFHAFLICILLLLLLLIQCKISLYLGPVRPVQCFVTPGQ